MNLTLQNHMFVSINDGKVKMEVHPGPVVSVISEGLYQCRFKTVKFSPATYQESVQQITAAKAKCKEVTKT